jgi:hypothetical protein
VQPRHVTAGQHRAALVTADAAHRLRVADAEVDDGGGRGGEGGAGALVGGRAAAEGEHRVLAVQQVRDDRVLQLAEGRLAVVGEDPRDRPARRALDDVVAVGERDAELRREQAADRGLARAHEADDDDHGAASSAAMARRARA